MDDQRSQGQSATDWYDAIDATWPKSILDAALRALDQSPEPSPSQYDLGMPIQIFARIAELRSDCPLAMLPDPNPSFENVKPGVQTKLLKKLAGPDAVTSKGGDKVRRTERGGANRARYNASVSKPHPETQLVPNEDRQAKASRQNDRGKKRGRSAKSTGGLLGLLKRKTAEDPQARLKDICSSATPLWDADALFQDDEQAGIEAYTMLLRENPRWALARFRLGEALVGAGHAEGIEHLMASAEQLPSALPSVLDAMGGGLAMLSPLEEEPLRVSIRDLTGLAPKIAAERETIDLDNLSAPNLDAQDAHTLRRICEDASGLSEAWVFGAPAQYLDNVPHHALFGVAPSLSDEALQSLSLQLAEHAAIRGTTAVHLERAKPSGALGTITARHTVFWRRPTQAPIKSRAA